MQCAQQKGNLIGNTLEKLGKMSTEQSKCTATQESHQAKVKMLNGQTQSKAK